MSLVRVRDPSTSRFLFFSQKIWNASEVNFLARVFRERQRAKKSSRNYFSNVKYTHICEKIGFAIGGLWSWTTYKNCNNPRSVRTTAGLGELTVHVVQPINNSQKIRQYERAKPQQKAELKFSPRRNESTRFSFPHENHKGKDALTDRNTKRGAEELIINMIRKLTNHTGSKEDNIESMSHLHEHTSPSRDHHKQNSERQNKGV